MSNKTLLTVNCDILKNPSCVPTKDSMFIKINDLHEDVVEISILARGQLLTKVNFQRMVQSLEESWPEEEEKVEEEEEFHSDVSVDGEEYIPPGGLFVPGLYSPPNDLAKANGLAYFYPKIVSELATIESEFLPPHVLVMFSIDKRQDVKEIMDQYPEDILNYGIFIGDDPYSAEHLAYTIKQYNKMERVRKHKDRLAIMVSRKRSLALLQLAGLNPCYISSDVASGEKECLTMFPVGYGDDYFEEESVQEEEVTEVVAVTEPVESAEPDVTEEAKGDEDEDEDED